MMKSITSIIYSIIAILVVTVSVFSTSHAVTISYQGTITPSFSSGIGSGSTGGQAWIDEIGASDSWSTVTGSVGDRGWVDSIAEKTDFWSFAVGPGGTSLDIWALRGDDDLDPALSIYSGITTADESTFQNGSNFGGITFSKAADDEIPNDGTFGDPAVYNMAFDEGLYTIAIGGYASDSEGPFSYDLSIGTPGTAPAPPDFALDIASSSARALEPTKPPLPQPAVVPIPGAFLFFATGLFGFVSARKFKQ
jgi:hypothetical protein